MTRLMLWMLRALARFSTVVLAVLGFVVLFSPDAQAYLDPGSGSYLFQIIIGVVLGAGVALRMFWHRIIAVFRRLFRRGGSDGG